MTTLRDELLNDPLGRGYAGMSDQAAADDLNTAYRTRQRETMDSAEIYENIDISEFQAKTDAQKVYVRDILGLGANVRIGASSKARMVMVSVFGGGSSTIANLADAATENISRAVELGIQPLPVKPGHVQMARG